MLPRNSGAKQLILADAYAAPDRRPDQPPTWAARLCRCTDSTRFGKSSPARRTRCFSKVDVQGFEGQVLAGADRILGMCVGLQPGIVIRTSL